MSCIAVDDGSAGVCANCGKHESDTVKLKNCTACRLVKYCGVDCQRAHRKLHKKACKQRVAELKDEQLYSQGLERPEGDFCPICTLPIPFRMNENSLSMTCCMKRIGRTNTGASCLILLPPGCTPCLVLGLVSLIHLWGWLTVIPRGRCGSATVRLHALVGKKDGQTLNPTEEMKLDCQDLSGLVLTRC